MTQLSTVPYGQFVAALAKPGAAIVASMTAEKAHAMHMAVGVAGEAGELLECFQKHAQGEPLDMENAVEELGDIEFYLEGLRQATGLRSDFDGVLVGEPQLAGRHVVTIAVLAGALLDVIKKHVIYNKPLDTDKALQYITALETQLLFAYEALKVTREEVIAANMKKLGVRYSSGSYSDKQAQVRADKAEGQ